MGGGLTHTQLLLEPDVAHIVAREQKISAYAKQKGGGIKILFMLDCQASKATV